MAIFDRLRSRPPERPDQHQASASGEMLTDPAPHSQVISEAVPPAPGFEQGDAPRYYNPYEGLSAALDSKGGLRGVYKLPQQPEFLFSEEAQVHRRTWSENLTYYTGMGYLSGALVGGGQGVLAAAQVRPEIGPDTARLRVNRLLNMSGTRGRTAGNALGVLGLFYAAMESGIGYAADSRVPDAAVSVGSGFATGALFRSSRGPRAAAIAGAVGAVAASGLVAARELLSKNL